MTRAFTGRLARGIRNRVLDCHSTEAPTAYPELHHLTAPLRQAGRTKCDPGLVNLWTGQAYELGRQLPADQALRQHRPSGRRRPPPPTGGQDQHIVRSVPRPPAVS